MSPFTTDNSVFITSIGMASCVGLNAADSCASVRAGLSRFSPVDGVMDYDDDELEAPITGASQPLLTRGFILGGRPFAGQPFEPTDVFGELR